MRNLRILLLLIAMTAACYSSSRLMAESYAVKNTYMFGFAASFSDSIIHFTEIQQIDSAWFDTKTKFLLGRDNYSYQLRDYLADNHKMPHRTCIVIYGDNKKKLEKKYLKMRRQYQTSQRNNFDIRTLGPADFKFKAVSMAFAVTDEEMEKITKKPKKNKKR